MTEPKTPEAEPEQAKAKTRTKREPDPYKDYADAETYPAVLLLATGEKVGSASVQSTHHYSPELDCDVPVVGALAR